MITRFISFFDLSGWIRLFPLLAKAENPDNLSISSDYILNSSYSKVTNSGREALSIILQALDLPKGAVIGVQPYTCISVFQTIYSLGFGLRFLDIKNDLTIDLDDLTTKLKGIHALIVTHTLGAAASVNDLKKMGLDIPLIEDCAHALGTPIGNGNAGNFGDFSFYSFGNGKLPAFGKGGLLVCNNEKYLSGLKEIEKELHQVTRAQSFKDWLAILGSVIFYGYLSIRMIHVLKKYFRKRRSSNLASQNLSTGRKEPSLFLKNLVVNDITRSLALIKLQLSNFIVIKNLVSKDFDSVDSVSTNGFYFILLEEERDELFDFLFEKGIECGKHFDRSLEWAKQFGYQEGDCLNFEKLYSKVLAVPCHYSLSPSQIQYLVTHLNEWKRNLKE